MESFLIVLLVVFIFAALACAGYALVLLDRLAEGTDRIAEIMRRSHAADLDRYDERLKKTSEALIKETALRR